MGNVLFAAAGASEPPNPFDALIDLAVSVWWLWPLLILIAVARQRVESGGKRKQRRRQPSATPRPRKRHPAPQRRERPSARLAPPVVPEWQPADEDDIDSMTGPQFERRLVVLFRDLGYSATHTGRLGDFGADLVVERDGTRTVVQAKR